MKDESKKFWFHDKDENDLTNNFSIKNNVENNANPYKDNKIKIINNIEIISKSQKYFNYPTKIFLIIIIFFICLYKVEVFEIDLNNYIDNIYGEEDLLKVIKEKEKEKEMLFISKERREEIEKQIKNIYNAIEQIKKRKKEIINNNRKIIRDDGKLILACSYALNNGFTYPTLVAMTSLAINAGQNIFYNIYVLISPDFTEENKQILMSVEKNIMSIVKYFLLIWAINTKV